MSSSERRPTRTPTFDFGTVVILSTIIRHVTRNPLRGLGLTGSRNNGASVSVAGEGADGDRIRGVETIVLYDNDGARLSGITLTSSDGPDIAASHPLASPNSDAASMNA
jgi:hypothetical protein